jgi:hypothetical protein
VFFTNSEISLFCVIFLQIFFTFLNFSLLVTSKALFSAPANKPSDAFKPRVSHISVVSFSLPLKLVGRIQKHGKEKETTDICETLGLKASDGLLAGAEKSALEVTSSEKFRNVKNICKKITQNKDISELVKNTPNHELAKKVTRGQKIQKYIQSHYGESLPMLE